MLDKKILDVCCGPKYFWFDKNNENVLFVDKRKMSPRMVGKGQNARRVEVDPDQIEDFRELSFKDNTFSLVVFDPPHFNSLGDNSFMGLKYGILDKENWKDDLQKGFSECFRVLKSDGVLIFKWNEYDIPLKEILKLTPNKPLFGHKSGKFNKTHWVCFMKINN
jgi:SAM-dependent methyltransferase